MKRKTLTTAVLAGLTGMAGMVSVSNAVNVNPDGLGQVLLYPYYTVRGGNDTLISIVNTTDNAKSVKIRFIEALNSREVLDFNIYLSPFDVWTTAISETEGGGAKINISDETCTSPDLLRDFGGEQPFLENAYNADGGPTSIDRTASGYIEVIEMGTLVGQAATSVTHVNGQIPNSAAGGDPRPCGLVNDYWSVIGGSNGAWLNDATVDHEAPSGGLFGSGSIVNSQAGTMLSYNAIAIDGFSNSILHTNPGDLFPSLAQAETESNVFINGVVDTQTWSDGVLAVNAVLTHDTIMNEFVTGGSANGRSEWVVTFPTKRFHTDAAPDGIIPAGNPAVPPFTSTWTADSPQACENVNFTLWNREEQTAVESTGPIVSPPPDDDSVDFELCYESNVIRFGGSTIPDNTEILGELTGRNVTNLNNQALNFDSDAGWVRFTFDNNNVSLPADSGDQYLGLPVIGFWASTFNRGNLEDPDTGNLVRANYGGTFQHRGTRQVIAAD